ncbi:organic anion transporter 3-like [Oratosquilla oratoria]|uniref:organic anion transporter 3-like n=1 Tax=Oratosquilla oratoria TaxID=337810 RepID=UPI003F7590E8
MIFDVNTFLYMIFTGLMEVPAYIIAVPIIARFGRKRPIVFSYTVTAITLFCIPVLPQDYMLAVVILAMTGKFCISCVLQVIFLYAMELLPTQVRARGFGTSLLVSKFGMMLTPFIIDVVGGIYPWLPSIIFGILSVVAGLSIALLPETLNHPLYETVAALEGKEENKEEESFQSGIKMDEMEALNCTKVGMESVITKFQKTDYKL